jgi:Type VI secretion system/phage-baseplate injector OB domain
MSGPLWGKYRGVVTKSVDPSKLGRVMVSVPSVMNQATWAMPCVPYTGRTLLKRQIPPVGTPVWIEFEGGDVSQPIWVGRFWSK